MAGPHRQPAVGACLPPELTRLTVAVTARLDALASGLPEPLRTPVIQLAGRPAKHLRSMLLGACARFGMPDWNLVVRLGALVELLHLASLLHDDVVDRAATRRGGPAAHLVIGRERAVLAGLACFALAGMEAGAIGNGLDHAVSAAVSGLAYGQVLDVERAFDTRLSLEDYLDLAERKTGELFGLSATLGAAAGSVDSAVAAALARFGADFGVAFQILDDCLDLQDIGQGKPAGIDHAMGVFGAPTLCALAAESDGRLAELLLSPTFSEADLPEVAALVAVNGGLTAAAGLARERYHRALAALDPLGTPFTLGLLDAVAHVAGLSR